MNGILEFAEAAMPWIVIAVFLAAYFTQTGRKEGKDDE